MAREASLIIRGGTLVDGTGAAPYEADIAIGDGRILEIGKISARAAEEIDAKGLIIMMRRPPGAAGCFLLRSMA